MAQIQEGNHILGDNYTGTVLVRSSVQEISISKTSFQIGKEQCATH